MKRTAKAVYEILVENRTQRVLKLLPCRDPYSEFLPVLTSANDIRELVKYLKRRSDGVIVAEELDRARKRLFEEKKLAAYRVLGITTNNDRVLTLSPLGWQFSKRLQPETQIFRHLLERTPPYWAAVKWIHRKDFDVVTSNDLLGFWHESDGVALERDNYESMNGAAISFFSFCRAAELGTVILGKRGHTTRLCVDHEELTRFLEESSSNSSSGEEGMSGPEEAIPSPDSKCAADSRRAPLKILILKRGNDALVDLIRRTLEIANVGSLATERSWDAEADLDDDLRKYANEYDALIVVLDEQAFAQDVTGRHGFKQKVLMGIGAALVLFKRRVIILSDKQFPPPEDINDLIYYQLEKGALPWGIGLELINTIEGFKNEVGRSTPL